MAFFLGYAGLMSLHGSYLELYASTFLSWFGYLTAHKSINGVWVDHGSDHEHETNLEGTAAGTLMIATATLMGAVYVPANNLEMTTLAASIFVGGYLVAHYYSTGKLL